MSRSTSNKYDAGGPSTRDKRKVWLVETFRADFDAVVLNGQVIGAAKPGTEIEGEYTIEAACRCYRCGDLLIVANVTPDRRVPGCEGGTYDEDNIRPACGPCNSSTGGKLGASRMARAS